MNKDIINLKKLYLKTILNKDKKGCFDFETSLLTYLIFFSFILF